MKILIGYDGSTCSDVAIAELQSAGLPSVAEALVLCVAEMPIAEVMPSGAYMASPLFVPHPIDAEPGPSDEEVHARDSATRAASQVKEMFPGWTVKTESWVDAAAPAILRHAEEWRPDLIVLGSHGRAGFSRFVLGSVSLHVLHHVACSVRICRHHNESNAHAIRLLIGVDGSDQAKAAVEAVASRNWPAATEVRVVGVLASRHAPPTPSKREKDHAGAGKIESAVAIPAYVSDSVARLTEAGLHASERILFGSAGDELLLEAESWEADCIFLGARGLSGIAQFLLGSVSMMVSSHAHCSVEVIKTRHA